MNADEAVEVFNLQGFLTIYPDKKQFYLILLCFIFFWGFFWLLGLKALEGMNGGRWFVGTYVSTIGIVVLFFGSNGKIHVTRNGLETNSLYNSFNYSWSDIQDILHKQPTHGEEKILLNLKSGKIRELPMMKYKNISHKELFEALKEIHRTCTEAF